MAALVTLADGKKHLNVTSIDRDSDILDKIEQASDIVVDYLKSRGHPTATIEESTVANPTVLTTEEDHGFTTGQTVEIEDHDDSTPDINGSHVLTVITPRTFSIPVNVTVAGTGGVATMEWTPTTVPKRVRAAVLLVLEDLFEHRPIDWEAQRRLLERSRDPAFA